MAARIFHFAFPVRWMAEDGKDGKNGENGKDAITIELDRTSIVHKYGTTEAIPITVKVRDGGVLQDNSTYTIEATSSTNDLNIASTSPVPPNHDLQEVILQVLDAKASPNGTITITVTYKGNKYTVTVGITTVKDGQNGTNVKAQYCTSKSSLKLGDTTTAPSGNWHDTFATGDEWMRLSEDGGKNWGEAIRIVGEAGAAGTDGAYTNYTFNLSKEKTTTDVYTAPANCMNSNWQDAPLQPNNTYPYLWMRAQRIDPDSKVAVIAGHEYTYTRMTGEKGQKGDPGNDGVGIQGVPGCSQRVFTTYAATELTSSGNSTPMVYHNDAELQGNGLHYIDFMVVRDDSMSSGFRAYRCKKTHTAAATWAQDNTTTNWEETDFNAVSAFFMNLVAKNATIEMLTGSCFAIMDKATQKIRKTGIANPDDDTKPAIWAGATTTDPTSAPFWIDNEGFAHAKKLRIGNSEGTSYIDLYLDANENPIIEMHENQTEDEIGQKYMGIIDPANSVMRFYGAKDANKNPQGNVEFSWNGFDKFKISDEYGEGVVYDILGSNWIFNTHSLTIGENTSMNIAGGAAMLTGASVYIRDPSQIQLLCYDGKIHPLKYGRTSNGNYNGTIVIDLSTTL